jgi:hypothetical protein
LLVGPYTEIWSYYAGLDLVHLHALRGLRICDTLLGSMGISESSVLLCYIYEAILGKFPSTMGMSIWNSTVDDVITIAYIATGSV